MNTIPTSAPNLQRCSDCLKPAPVRLQVAPFHWLCKPCYAKSGRRFPLAMIEDGDPVCPKCRRSEPAIQLVKRIAYKLNGGVLTEVLDDICSQCEHEELQERQELHLKETYGLDATCLCCRVRMHGHGWAWEFDTEVDERVGPYCVRCYALLGVELRNEWKCRQTIGTPWPCAVTLLNEIEIRLMATSLDGAPTISTEYRSPDGEAQNATLPPDCKVCINIVRAARAAAAGDLDDMSLTWAAIADKIPTSRSTLLRERDKHQRNTGHVIPEPTKILLLAPFLSD